MGRKSTDLAKNPYIQELFGILKENDKDTAGLNALLSYVKQMEKSIKSSEKQLSEMKSQLSDMKEIQKHPVKYALNNTVQSLEKRLSSIKIQLDKIREGIVNGCKNTINEVKNNGIVTLDKLASFFHIKQGFEIIEKNSSASIQDCNKAINKIESFSKEYHETGLHLKNMFRVAVGKEPLDKAKEVGIIAKTMCSPYKLERKCAMANCETAKKVMTKLEELSKSSEEIKVSKKQSAKEHLAKCAEKAEKVNTTNIVSFPAPKPTVKNEEVAL